jgi:hypothetical protein
MAEDKKFIADGMKFVEDDEYRAEYHFKDGFLKEIKITIRNDDFFPQSDIDDKRVFIGWLKWLNKMLYNAMLNIPTMKIAAKISEQDKKNMAVANVSEFDVVGEVHKPTAPGGEAEEGPMQVDMEAEMEDAPMAVKKQLMDQGKMRVVNCPQCNKDVYVRKNCCKPEFNGICGHCKTKIKVPA